MKMGYWLIALVVSTIAGWLGWYAGELIGTTTAFIVSVVASGWGLWYGRKVARNILG